MSPATVVTSTFPLVVIVCPHEWTDAWVEGLRRDIDRVLDRQERFACIADSRDVPVPGARHRKQLTDWLTEPSVVARQKRWNVGNATILASPLMRGAMQAMQWVWTPPTPQYGARDLDDAWAWSVERLLAADVPLPRPSNDLLAMARGEVASMRRLAGFRRTPRDVA